MQTIKPGDTVEILSCDNILEVDYTIGEECEVYEVNEYSPGDTYNLKVYTKDKTEWWHFEPNQVKLTKESK